MKQKPFIIMGALDEEVAGFLDFFGVCVNVTWHNYTFWEGEISGISVVIARSGIGKVNAALVAQHLIDMYEPCALVFTGFAGALIDDLAIGDVVVSSDLVQHDVRTSDGEHDHRILFSNRSDSFLSFTADRDLVHAALSCHPRSGKIVEGRIVTGDRFIGLGSTEERKHLSGELKGIAVEMEGGAVAHVCTVNAIPFVVVRTISDNADAEASQAFTEAISEVAYNSLDVVRCIMSTYADR